jgi:hypothetical protein
VHEERSTYYLRRTQAVQYHNDYLSIIIDGADQSAYGLPHFCEKDKLSSNMLKMPVYLMGALVHGYRAYGFTYLKNIKHGSNIVLECLHHILCDVLATRKHIPPIIFLQLDNTSKQNKNKYILACLCCLIAWGVSHSGSFLSASGSHA